VGRAEVTRPTRVMHRRTHLAACLVLAACGGGDARTGDTSTANATPTTNATATAAAGGARPVIEGEVRGCPATRDRAPSASAAIRAIPVNRGTHGMMARTRWLASPDGCAILVVEDPVAVEAEPVPNGALLVSERGAEPVVIAIDSAWDIAVDSAWTKVAIGRGWILSAGESDTVPRAKWEALSRATGVDARALEAQSFNGSGMAYARGVALAYVRPLGDATAKPRPIGPGGWRVRWRHDTLFVGDAPATAQDYAEPTRWSMHVAPDFGPVAIPTSFAPPPERWAEGPTIDFGVEQDTAAAGERRIELAGGRVAVSRGGALSLLAPGQPARAVGPGTLLAATLGGRFILALRPTPKPREFDPKLQLVVYEVP
jgi:hypothetical protein